MKQNTPAIYLQISTAQGPAECRIFARFVLGDLCKIPFSPTAET